MPYTIITPIAGQNISASLFGIAVKNAIDNLDLRVGALEAFTAGKPMVKIQAGAAQSFADNTDVATIFAAADILDTHNFHDPAVNNTRITPNVAGTYRLQGVVYLTGATTFTTRKLWWRKNGSLNFAPGDQQGNSVNAVFNKLEATTVDTMNGTSDYFELVVNQDNTANAPINSNQGGQFSSTIICEYLRGF
jgi:hypothetical protein